MIDVPWQLLGTPVGEVVVVALGGLGVYLAVIVATRIVGLRSLATMSAFDFAMTVAIGSLVASTVLSKDPPLLLAVVGLAALFALQMAVALLRQRFEWAAWLVDNRPVLLMEDGRMLERAMRKEEVTQADLVAKLREANVLDLARVRAVVLESTGDISVLHGEVDEGVDDLLLDGVRRY